MLRIDALKAIYSNEEVLVIALTRLYFGTQSDGEVIQFIKATAIDWESFYKIISINHIRGFIYDVITTWQIETDQQVYDNLKKEVMKIGLLQSHHIAIRNQLKTEFDLRGVTVIPYKGTTLAARYYKTPQLRENLDLDFLVSKHDLPQIKACLLSNGYKLKHPIQEHLMPLYVRWYRELGFTSYKHKLGYTCSVEFHWKLLDNYTGKFHQYDFFVQHLESYADIDGTLHQGLSPTYDFLCVSSHHLVRESLNKFKYLIDLACIIQSSSVRLNWEEIDKHYKQFGFSPVLHAGICTIEEIIGLPIPVSPAHGVSYRLFTTTEITQNLRGAYKLVHFSGLKLQMGQKIRLKMRYMLFSILPDHREFSRNIPLWAIPLTIPVKGIRFIYKRVTGRY
ncbi:nucleotidyltransferase family protein [Chitinophaga sp. Cy-1792]|uniref:nucleotidyltransferase family protein n=1 Tax=Chitinophaga sp. Cy-1792 TaxID=2608339 RepID=UPI00141E9831|nr:nucleotidyltransferase family protein [Chitinophaga sp. Cy-1792]NIG55372.1 nucleotidyltransferase family protein [Chitinophaga sp. Cy-1792]